MHLGLHLDKVVAVRVQIVFARPIPVLCPLSLRLGLSLLLDLLILLEVHPRHRTIELHPRREVDLLILARGSVVAARVQLPPLLTREA